MERHIRTASQYVPTGLAGRTGRTPILALPVRRHVLPELWSAHIRAAAFERIRKERT